MRVVGIIQITKEKFLLIHRVKPNEDYFTFPGGAIEEGESEEDTLKREMQEELGISDIQFRKVFELTNRENQEHWYFVDGFRGVPVISGPEKERTNEQNQYLVEYKSLEEMRALDNFFPKEAIEMIGKSIGSKSELHFLLSKEGEITICPVAVFIKNGEILSGLRHYTPEKWKNISVWTFPGGRCDTGETIEQTLRREVFEEVGITDFEITEYIGGFPGAKEGDGAPVFICKTDQEPKLMEPEKFSEWRWFIIDQLPENFINNAIMKGKIIVSEKLIALKT